MFILTMFRKNKLKNRIRNFFIIFFILSLTLLVCKLFFNYKYKKDINNLSDSNTFKIISEESLLKEIKNVNKIIPLEVELSKIITIDKSWGNLEVFQKFKRIKFFANCSYSIDLSNLTTNDINIDSKKNELSINFPNPQIFSINIDKEKTVYEDSSNGLLRFGEIKLTSEEFNIIQNEVQKSFEETMKDDEIYEKVLSDSKISIENLLNQITDKKMSISIYFK
ncbi:hypothetical protein A500_12439 [Clostridium sartagoforme AAU1]|uniref:DUF4230 domain-containing protein n=1 Tax=Clostridium sartagoforme AAU1 TaxID=1202534 RepID=R9CB59_9CLOT|nr:DUF4230 domain-containing protein [Clostridium sartagoforme]EOR24411.1 hypothetical protein A500_12439 [Clostridium sartagoforme AAU1]